MFPAFPQLEQCVKQLLVCLFVVKPVVELTQADEDEFSKNLKQLQTDV